MPICTSQGQISCGRAWMVTARVALNVGCFTTSSPGMAQATSSSVAPQRNCQGRMKRRYTPNEMTPTTAKPTPILFDIVIDPYGEILYHRCVLAPRPLMRLPAWANRIIEQHTGCHTPTSGRVIPPEQPIH